MQQQTLACFVFFIQSLVQGGSGRETATSHTFLFCPLGRPVLGVLASGHGGGREGESGGTAGPAPCGDTHHALLRLDEGPTEAVHLAVKAACITQVVACTISSPQRRLDGAAVHTLATFGQILQQVCGEIENQKTVRSPALIRSLRRAPGSPRHQVLALAA